MALDVKQIRNRALQQMGDDVDGIFTDAGKPTPNPDSVELKGMVHYITKAVIEAIKDDAEIDAGIEVVDTATSTKLGETEAGPAGIIS